MTDPEPPATNDGLHVKFLRDIFASEQTRLHTVLRASDRIPHHGDRGEVNEQVFIEFLRAYLPDRYTVDKATVLDSDGRVSDSIDVVVFDRHFTPTLLDDKKHRYVPAEAVYGVFECKPTIDKAYLEYAANKAASVRRLKRTTAEFRHATGRTTTVAPPILAGILAIEVSWKDGLGGKPFQDALAALDGDRKLDCGLAASGACFDTFADDGSLSVGPGGNALAFFAFRLLSRLQRIGSVPAADWMAYATRLADEDSP